MTSCIDARMLIRMIVRNYEHTAVIVVADAGDLIVGVNKFLSTTPKLFVGGGWVDPVDGEPFPSVAPATDELLTQIARGTVEDVDCAVAAAPATKGSRA